jgi:hypothetical protein
METATSAACADVVAMQIAAAATNIVFICPSPLEP